VKKGDPQIRRRGVRDKIRKDGISMKIVGEERKKMSGTGREKDLATG